MHFLRFLGLVVCLLFASLVLGPLGLLIAVVVIPVVGSLLWVASK